MTVLAALDLDRGDDRVMLIDPPDDVLAEAAGLDPRPSVASSLKVAEPARRIAWWPQRDDLSAASLSRLAWMLAGGTGSGVAWLILDEDDDSPTIGELADALEGSQLQREAERELGAGAVAVRVAPRDGARASAQAQRPEAAKP